MEIHIDRDGEQFGPYSLDDVNAYLADGTLLSSDMAWHNGLAEWTTLDQIEGVLLPEGHKAAEEYAEPEPAQAPAPKKGKPVAAAASGGGKKTLLIVLASVLVVGGSAAAVVFLVPFGGQTLWAKMTGGATSADNKPTPSSGPGGGMAAATTGPGGGIHFATQIKPIFEKSCIECHGAEKKKGNFRLDQPELALKGGESGLPAIVPGKSAESRLIKLVSREDPDSPMPPSADKALSREHVALLRQWIDQGAKFQ